VHGTTRNWTFGRVPILSCCLRRKRVRLAKKKQGQKRAYSVCIKVFQQVQEGLPVVGQISEAFEQVIGSMISPKGWGWLLRMRKLGHGTEAFEEVMVTGSMVGPKSWEWLLVGHGTGKGVT
jgi:hypothetical protein